MTGETRTKRIATNLTNLGIYAAVLVIVSLSARALGVSHGVAWFRGLIAGSFALGALQSSRLRMRSWGKSQSRTEPDDRETTD